MNEQIQKIVQEAIAAKIVMELSAETRDEILKQSLQKALNDYSFQRVIEQAVAKAAQEASSVLLKQEYWINKISSAIQDGFNKFIKRLEEATFKMLCENFAGEEKSSGYNYRGHLHSYLYDK